MKLITLNTWGGRALHPLMHFFRNRGPETDIFCLQEVFDTEQAELDARHPDEHVRGDLFKKISAELKDFEGSFAYFDDNPHRQSLAIFVRRSIPIKTIADFIVYKPEIPKEVGSAVFSSRKLQYVVLDTPFGERVICNFHGLWNGWPKTDTPERLAQSRSIKEFLEKTNGQKVLCGDFNLLPETESMRIVEEGMKNLVKEEKVKSTRTVLYRHYDDPNEPNFADYILVSPKINIKHFAVLPDIVSDHSPLYLEFE